MLTATLTSSWVVSPVIDANAHRTTPTARCWSTYSVSVTAILTAVIFAIIKTAKIFAIIKTASHVHFVINADLVPSCRLLQKWTGLESNDRDSSFFNVTGISPLSLSSAFHLLHPVFILLTVTTYPHLDGIGGLASGSALVSINKVALHFAQLWLGWVTMSGVKLLVQETNLSI